MASAEREPTTGVWIRRHQWGPEAEPLVMASGAKPPETESFEAFVRFKEGLKRSCQYAKTV